MRILFFQLILFVSLNKIFAEPWRHLKTIDPSYYNYNYVSHYISKWIIDEKKIRYCILIEDNVQITKNEATTQIVSAIMNWLDALNFYGINSTKEKAPIKIYRGTSEDTLIDISKIEIEEVLCNINSYGELDINYNSSRIPTLIAPNEVFSNINNFRQQTVIAPNEVLLFFFTKNIGRSYNHFTPTNIEFNNKKIKNTETRMYIEIMMGSEINSGSLINISDRVLTSGINNILNQRLQKPSNLGPRIENINHNIQQTSSYQTLLHEIGHAFGLGDEYEGGLKANNDTNNMSTMIMPSVMKDGDQLYPTIDDTIGLVYLFDRLAGRDIKKREFNFTDYHKCYYTTEILYGCTVFEDDEIIIRLKGTREKPIHSLVIKKEISEFYLYDIQLSDEDLEVSILPTIIDQTYKSNPNNSLILMNIEGSNITTIPSNISSLKDLKLVSFSSNKIEVFPDSLLELSKLNYLNLSCNNIKSIPKEISKLTNLKILYLSDNPISSIPNELLDLKNLEQLFINADNLDDKGKLILNTFTIRNEKH